jgi:RHS repeat-associated protein
VSDPQRGLTWRFGRHSGYFCSSEGHGELPLVALHDRAGHEITFGYDETGAPAWIRHSGGYHVRVTVAAGRVTGLAAGKADGTQLLRYSYDEDGNLAGVSNSSHQPLLFRYDEASRLTGWRDRNGYGYGYGYDDQGRCVRGDGPSGVLSGTVHYDPQAQVTTSTDAAGAVTTYQLRGAYVVAMTDPLGHVSRWEHDERGQLTERTDPLGRVTRYTFDARGNLTTIARPDGSQAQAEYDERDLPVRLAEPGGHVWRQEYDARGSRTQVTAPNGAVTRFCYDDHGHLASITDPGGTVTLVACDAVGLPVRVTGVNGAVTSLERDPLGRVTRITRPGGGTTELTWTPEGQPASRSLPDGTAEFWNYDAEGNLTRYLSLAGALTRYEYGPFDQLVARTAPDGSRTQIGYDHALRMTSVHRAGLTWSYDYDLAGRLVAETDFNGARTSYEHDAGGQLIGQVNACGQRIAFCHDQLGNVAKRTSGQATTTFGYDLAGRLIYARNPEAEIWLDRDPLGRIIAETCNGRTVTSEYDAAGRRRRRVTPFGAVTDWDYDQAGQLVVVTAGGHQIQFDYDEAGQEIRRELPGGLVLAQDWDQRGRLTVQSLTAWGQEQAVLPEGPMPVGPAAAGRPTAGGHTAGRPMAGRPTAGGPTARGLTAGGPTAGGQPVTGGRLLQHRTYAYNGDGLVTGIDDLLAGARRIGLDRSGRVTAVIGPDWAERYTYDPAGNLSGASWPAPPDAEVALAGLWGAFSVVRTENAPHSPAGLGRGAHGPRQVTGTLITRAGNVRYRHDRQGRVVQRQVPRISRKPDTWHYHWDADSRMSGVTTPDGTTWRYRYDPFGRRIAKQRLTGDGSIAEQTDFTWDGPVLAEQATPAAQPGQYEVVTWDYRPGSFTALTQAEHTSADDLGDLGDPGEASQEQINQRFYAIIADLVGTPAELVAPDGTLAGCQQHTLWGNTVWHPDGAQTPLRFPGQYADPETGLHYNHHRYYDPVAGSYLTPDPLGLAAAPNPHAYVPNPQVLADPLGLSPYESTAELGGASPGAGVGGRARQVIVDTNSVYSRPGVEAALNPGETPVITQTTVAELRNLAAGGVMKMPRFAGELPVINDVMDVNMRINIREMLTSIRANQRGIFGDGSIGATALDYGLPVITADRNFAAVLEHLGLEVRKP